eukprot:TRINITY_DN12147_c1_g8_i1.p1 TRINITY_DN12147_c1_g8~~TRINITY_DN12147_c1_g8_i1.p1  ORF type:complete len:966 (+),score=250.17 TRINITY_DN12147_c1_g8_i1:21-2918(+)
MAFPAFLHLRLIAMGQKGSKDLVPAPAGPVSARGSPRSNRTKTNPYELSSNLPSPQLRPLSAALKRIYVQRDKDGSLGFIFSSFQRPYNQQLGTIHYIAKVDENSMAVKCGLKVGQRIIRINNKPIGSSRHKEVVEMIQSRPPQQPIVLHIAEANQETQQLLQRQAKLSTHSHSSQTSPANARGRTRPSTNDNGGQTRSVVAAVSPPNDKDMHLMVQKTASSGWSLIETQAQPNEDYETAIHRHLAETFARPPSIAGLLRFEHAPPAKGQSVTRVVFHVECSAAVGDSEVPMTTTSPYHRATWMSTSAIAKLHRRAGPAPWGSGPVGLGHVEVLDWARYLSSGCLVAPLHFLAVVGDKVWNEKTGGTSAAVKREQQRRRSFTGNKGVKLKTEQSNQEQAHTNGHATHVASNGMNGHTNGHATKLTLQPIEPEPEANSEPPTPSMQLASFTMPEPPSIPPPDEPAPEPRDTELTPPASRLSSRANSSRRVSFAEDRNTEHLTYHKEEYHRQLDATVEGFKDLRELVSSNQGKLEEEQKAEVELSIEDKRLRAFYVLKEKKESFGFTMKAAPKTQTGSLLSEHVIIDTMDPTMALAADGNCLQGDRIVKINSQLVVSLQHATYLMEIINTHPALDITICRDEPLPEMIDLTSLTDFELQEAAFDHYGLRILVDPNEGWTREQTIDTLEKRFAPASNNGMLTFTPAAEQPSSQADIVSPATSARHANGKSSLRRKGDTTRNSLRVGFVEDNPTEHETYTQSEYARPLDPGSDHSDLRSLFFHNQQVLEQEQQREAEDYCETRRMRNYYITKQRAGGFGFKIEAMPKDLSLGYLFLEGVAIVDIDASGPLGKSGIVSGDRLVKVNGQWVLNHQHAEYLLFDLLRRARALDLTVCRGDEPLPAGVDLNTITDQELQELALEHAGIRADLEQGTHTRDKLTMLVRRRFGASSTAAVSNLQGQDEEEEDEEC